MLPKARSHQGKAGRQYACFDHHFRCMSNMSTMPNHLVRGLLLDKREPFAKTLAHSEATYNLN